MNPIKDNLHPLYTEYIKDWNYYRDHYKGGREFLRKKDYLFKYDLEPQHFYSVRKKRAVYHNYCSSIVDTYVHYIYSRDISREADDYEYFLDDCNLRGKNFTDYMKNKVAPWALVYGHIFVFVDMPDVEGVKTLREAKELNVRPYVTTIHPTNLLDWSVDEWGQPVFVKWQEPAPDITNPEDTRKEEGMYYRVWTRDYWALYDSEGSKIKDGVNKLGVIPIVPVYAGEQEVDFMGSSLIKDISGLNNRIYNWESEIDEAVNKQMFSQLVVKSRSESNEVGVGKSAMLKLDPDANEDVYYVSPDVAPLSTISDMIDKTKVEIYRIAMKQDKTGVETAVAQSGISKAFDFEQANRALGAISKSFETAEYQIFNYIARWEGKTEADIKIDYPEKFDVFNFSSELQEMLAINNIGSPSKTFTDELWKMYINKKLNNLESEKLQKIYSEIEGELNTEEGKQKLLEEL